MEGEERGTDDIFGMFSGEIPQVAKVVTAGCGRGNQNKVQFVEICMQYKKSFQFFDRVLFFTLKSSVHYLSPTN